MNIDNKIEWIVSRTLDSESGGKKFFDKLDKEIRKDSNLDLIIGLLERIYLDFPHGFNLVVSGNFGDWIYYLLKKKTISHKGCFLQLSGSITSHDGSLNLIKPNKSISIQRLIGSIENQNFVFLDDSYYSGTTERLIDKFLNNYNSRIIRTYVIYDGNDHKNPNRKSLYSYYDHHEGSKVPFFKLLNHLYKYKDLPHNEIEEKIVNGSINTYRQLNDIIDKHLNTQNKYLWTHRNESRFIKTFDEFN